MIVPDLKRLGTFLFCNIFRHYEERSDVVISFLSRHPPTNLQVRRWGSPTHFVLLRFIFTGGLPSPHTYVRVG